MFSNWVARTPGPDRKMAERSLEEKWRSLGLAIPILRNRRPGGSY